uniref:Uncharacterized protein n=1 Tax=Lepeophtheirus salmonis TaxID=72036 RepID=A0A0K2V4X6_LEPSM
MRNTMKDVKQQSFLSNRFGLLYKTERKKGVGSFTKIWAFGTEPRKSIRISFNKV